MRKISDLYYSKDEVIDASEITINDRKFLISANNEIFAPYETIENILELPPNSFQKRCQYQKFYDFMKLNFIYVYHLKNLNKKGKGTNIVKGIKKSNLQYLIEYEVFNSSEPLLEKLVKFYTTMVQGE